MPVELVPITPGDNKNFPKAGQIVTIHYVGTLDPKTTDKHGKIVDETGRLIDSSREREEPFEFILGAGMVIHGVDQGLLKMSLGQKAKLIIPPELGFGFTGIKHFIPGGSTVFFEVELLKIKNDW